MSVREGIMAGVPVRVLRVSFTGELSYEIHVACDCAAHLWQAVMQAGESFGITAYGTQAMHVLRAEKGFIIVGQDTDGTVTPLDLGMERMMSSDRQFIGARSLSRSDTRRADRKQLVGILPEDPNLVLPEGAALVAGELPRPRPRAGHTIPMLGHVTSSYWSANLGRSFGLALVQAGRARIGQWLWAPLDRHAARVQIVEPVFWDQEGQRQHA